MGNLARINITVAALRAFEALTGITNRPLKAHGYMSIDGVMNRTTARQVEYAVAGGQQAVLSMLGQQDCISESVMLLNG